KLVQLALERIPLGSLDQWVKPARCLRRVKLRERLLELVGLRRGDAVFTFVFDHSCTFLRSMAMIPLVSPVLLSIWKNSRNVLPAGFAKAKEGKSSPPYFAFCAARRSVKSSKTGSNRSPSTP